MPGFLSDLRKSDTSEAVRLVFESLILTDARTGEVVVAPWSEIDLEARLWTIPAEPTKAGREHKVPLADHCPDILIEARKLSDGSGYVFPGRVACKPLSNMVFLMALRGRDRARDGEVDAR